MPLYEVQLHDPVQGRRSLQVEAADALAAPAVLGLDCASVVAVREWPGSQTPGAAGGLRRRRAVLDPRAFSQELGLLLQAGVPLLDALQTLREQGGGAAAVLQGLCDGLRRGQAFSAALAEQPAQFSALLRALVAAGERTGQLPAVLADHASYLGWTAALRRQLVAASIYPLMLLAAGALVLGFLLIHVLPRFAGVFDGVGRDLPAGSAALMRLGVWAGENPIVLPAALGALLLLGVLMLRALSSHPSWTSWCWRLPGLGPRLRTLALARLYRTLGLLLQAGVPLGPALPLAAGVLPRTLQGPLQQVQQQVLAGQRLSQALEHEGLATPVASRMLRVGEGSGQVAELLQRAAGFHDEDARQLAELVARSVNPALMLIIGAVVGTVVVLMYLPIFGLMEQVG
jgi:general secretion pathway protein F